MPAIRIQTELPGPKSKAWLDRRAAAIPRGVYAGTPIFIHSAEGATFEDLDGNRFIDLCGGIGCINVGHRNPRVIGAIRRQLDSFLHMCFQVTGYESYVELAEKLNELTPGNFPKKTFFVNSGAEAVENAVKIARSHTGRSAVICFEDGFHGRTLMGLGLTSKTHPYKAGFGPFPSEIYRIPFGIPSRNRLSGKAVPTAADYEVMLEDVFRQVVAAEQVAAMVIEPVLGEGGFVVPPSGFLEVLDATCKKYGIVFVADEVQTGFGRTGTLFASEQFAIEPDLILTAKSLSGGLPLAAITGRAEIMDAPGPGGLGGTFGGNPVSCAAALSVIEEFADGYLLRRAKELGTDFRQRALAWQKEYEFIGDVRGLGAMQAIEFNHSSVDHEPYPAAAKKVIQYALKHGVLLLGAGTHDNVIRILMPLMISDEEFAEAMNVMEEGIAHAAKQVGKPSALAETVG
ncbi:Gamma-aminobutyrate:alpha-ketoglutarate aminotransferase [Acidisarcina polymorpha]|uniref:Gamma-aminobutyrate:alpha-ketoglutarate aminotransferase n=1 Tax=Acidisarcina polymorpha TaxID=2211140 RepID=A0A2Z5G1S6_9BACT|nr:4-aminobutyrate--2-oxoglutarate transaminase [Acidisarcina polymorpha]AXC13051.1 Gamma-aminobutyrate:alpha-ketoglutarate aminotransferase [Acidisarcina polymorpha]